MTTLHVAFPTASRPQAWSAGAPLLLLTVLLELEPGIDGIIGDASLPLEQQNSVTA